MIVINSPGRFAVIGCGHIGKRHAGMIERNTESEFVRVIEKRQGTMIGYIEEVAYRNGFINKEQLQKLSAQLSKSGYGKYMWGLLK